MQSIPQTANLISENAVEEDALKSGDVTDLSATNIYNNEKLKKPKLPPIKGMNLVVRKS